jgi:hypothetical protein
MDFTPARTEKISNRTQQFPHRENDRIDANDDSKIRSRLRTPLHDTIQCHKSTRDRSQCAITIHVKISISTKRDETQAQGGLMRSRNGSMGDLQSENKPIPDNKAAQSGRHLTRHKDLKRQRRSVERERRRELKPVLALKTHILRHRCVGSGDNSEYDGDFQQKRARQMKIARAPK